MTQEGRVSEIEKMLGFEFVSDPRKAKFKLPGAPADHPRGRPYLCQPTTFTPEQAADILKYRVIRRDRMPKSLQHAEMCSNRRFLINTLKGTSRRKGLVAVLRDGEWNHNTPQTASFTWDGFLLDGQHRFAASVLANKPITLPYADGTPWDAFDDIDSGRGRSADQLLGDVKYPQHVAAVARMVLAVIEGVERERWSIQNAPNQDIIDLVKGWPFFHSDDDSGVPWMLEVMQAGKTGVPIGPLAASVMMALAAGADPFHVHEFLDGLKSTFSQGYEDFKNGRDPRHMLRNLYLNPKARGTGEERKRAQVAHCRRAMEIWLDWKTGIRLHQLQKLNTPSIDDRLPEVWRADEVRAYHHRMVIS